MTPLNYLKSLRLHRARELILRSHHTARDAAEAVGYVSSSQFSREYKRQFGKTVREDIQSLATPGPNVDHRIAG